MTFLCHPEDDQYYEKLPLHEASATCILLQGGSAYLYSAYLKQSKIKSVFCI
jgi:hypothetical protein